MNIRKGGPGQNQENNNLPVGDEAAGLRGLDAERRANHPEANVNLPRIDVANLAALMQRFANRDRVRPQADAPPPVNPPFVGLAHAQRDLGAIRPLLNLHQFDHRAARGHRALEDLMQAQHLVRAYVGQWQQEPFPNIEVQQDASELNRALFNSSGPFSRAAQTTQDFRPRKRDSLLNLLRFFHAMDGPPQPFILRNHLHTAGQGTATEHTPLFEDFADTKSFVQKTLQSHPPKFCSIEFHGGKTKLYLHGEHNAELGKALYNLTGEFVAALGLVERRDQTNANNRLLYGLLNSMSEWCFDGVVTQMNQFLQENIHDDVNLSLTVQLKGDETLQQQAAEYARVFGLYQARKFTQETGHSPTNSDGTYDPRFAEHYMNAAQFLKFLQEHDSGSTLSSQHQEQMVAYVTAELAIF